MARFIIEGGTPLRGTVTAAANKNAILPIMAATLLTSEECVLHNVPLITDVITMGNLLKQLGATVEGLGTKTLRIRCERISDPYLDPMLARKLRASVLLLGPLLVRCGYVKMPLPGGCVIGRRNIGTHVDAVEALGARIDIEGMHFIAQAKRLQGCSIFLDEASVTATENTLMAAALSCGETTIKHAACEPHVEDLTRFLLKMGAQITGSGSNILRIEGVSELHGAEHEIIPDHIDIGTFAVAAAMSRGEVAITGVVPADLDMTLLVLRRMGVECELSDTTLHVCPSHLSGTRKIDTDPWPGFPTDLASVMITLATQAEGTTLVHDWMYEGRMFFVEQLASMGAHIVLCDPHRCVITGPRRLMARDLYAPDLRAGMALVLAAVCAEGHSEVSNIELVERGYENITDRLSALGAKIEKVS